MPRQFGPTIRMSCRRTASSRPVASAGSPDRPELITSSARTPRRPHCSATSGTADAGHAEHRQVDRLGQLVHRPVAVDAAHLRRMRVHRGEATGETGPDEVAQYGVAHRVRPAARTHDHHRPRREDRSQAARRPPVPRARRARPGTRRQESRSSSTCTSPPRRTAAPAGRRRSAPAGRARSRPARPRRTGAHRCGGPGTPGAPAGAFRRRASAPRGPRPARPPPSRDRYACRSTAPHRSALTAERAQRHVGRSPRRDQVLRCRAARPR